MNINLAKVVDHTIHETGSGDVSTIKYGEITDISIVPIPDWAMEIRTANLKSGRATKILWWNYETRVFDILEEPRVSPYGLLPHSLNYNGGQEILIPSPPEIEIYTP